MDILFRSPGVHLRDIDLSPPKLSTVVERIRRKHGIVTLNIEEKHGLNIDPDILLGKYPEKDIRFLVRLDF